MENYTLKDVDSQIAETRLEILEIAYESPLRIEMKVINQKIISALLDKLETLVAIKNLMNQ